MNTETKTCGKCKLDLPLSSFYSRPERNGIKKSCCKECHKAATKAYRIANPDKVAATKRKTVAKKPEFYKQRQKAAYLRRREAGLEEYTEKDWAVQIKHLYGITAEQYKEKLAAQNNACAICRKIPTYRLCVDHNHVTGKVRALLCKRCNFGIAGFRDDRFLLEQAIDYLTKHMESE